MVSVARTDVATSVYTHTAGLSALYLGFGGVLALSLVWPPAIWVSCCIGASVAAVTLTQSPAPAPRGSSGVLVGQGALGDWTTDAPATYSGTYQITLSQTVP